MGIINGLSKPVGAAVVPGGAATTSLGPAPGLSAGDTLINVRHITDDLATNADVTGEASITDDGEVTLTTTDTTGGFVLVVWQGAA